MPFISGFCAFPLFILWWSPLYGCVWCRLLLFFCNYLWILRNFRRTRTGDLWRWCWIDCSYGFSTSPPQQALCWSCSKHQPSTTTLNPSTLEFRKSTGNSFCQRWTFKPIIVPQKIMFASANAHIWEFWTNEIRSSKFLFSIEKKSVSEKNNK